MPETPSTRLRLHSPSSGDVADVPADFKRLRDQIDAGVIGYSGQGLMSMRPAAGAAGRLYYATDTETVYYDRGGTWAHLATGISTTQLADGAVTIAKTARGTTGLARGLFQTTSDFGAISVSPNYSALGWAAPPLDVSGWFVREAGSYLYYRPQEAGYYELSAGLSVYGYGGVALAELAILKNNLPYQPMQFTAPASDGSVLTPVSVRTFVYANGTTDSFGVGIVRKTSVALYGNWTATNSHFSGRFIGRA
jgi:hypothetical protein